MKTCRLPVRLIAIAVFLSFGLALMAQAGPGGGRWQGQGGPGPMMSPEQRLDHLSQQLNLTADQKAKIKPILEKEAGQTKALREDTSLAPQDRRSRFMELREKTTEDIKAVLTKDQQKKYDEMRSRMMERRGPRPGGPPPQQ